MKNLLSILTVILAFEMLLFQCANPKAPTGGPKDTIPPTLLKTVPDHGTVQFSGTELILEFNERITSDKIQTNLIITPQIDTKYKTIVKKNTLIMRFEEPFPDSTTMTLNFFDGITDITENNPAINLSYVFSTGSYIDSLSISGTVTDLMTQKPKSGFIVGLYPETDTLNYFNTKPYYFTTTPESGAFSITNIKNGDYRILAFKDANRNLIFDPTIEAYGFKSEIIQLDSNISNLEIRSLKQNVSEFALISNRTTGRYFDVRYTKGIDSVSVNPDLIYSYQSENNTIRFYKTDNLAYNDSLRTVITSFDSLGTKSIDTLFIKFQESARKAAPFQHTLSPQDQNIEIKQPFNIAFSKPIKHLDTSLLFFSIDSVKSIPVDTSINLNRNRTKVHWLQEFDTTSINKYLKTQASQKDSTTSDTTKINNAGKRKGQPANRRNADKSSDNILKLIARKGAFISIENDTLDEFVKNYQFPKKGNLGKLIININTEAKSYFIQLINKKFEPIKTFDGTAKLTLNIPAGEYGVRILIDDNQDGKWSNGNLLTNTEPERVVLYPEFTSLRANWDVNIDIQF